MGDATVQAGTQPNQQQGDPAAQNQQNQQGQNGNGATPTPQGSGEQLGEPGVKALQEERAARKAEADVRKQLEKRLDALKPFEEIAAKFGDGDAKKGTSEIQQLTERYAQLEKDIRDERDARWRAELAHEHGLTAKQASRLRGSTRDEMDADAKELVADFELEARQEAAKKPGAPKPDRSQGGGQNAGPSGKQQAQEQLAKRGFSDKKTT